MSRNDSTGAHSRPCQQQTTRTIYIWDLDETLIIYQTLLDNSFATKFNKNGKVAELLGLRMEKLIFKVSEEYFLFNELEGDNVAHVSLTSKHDHEANVSNIGKHYADVEKTYDKYRNNMKSLLQKSDHRSWSKLLTYMDILTESWRHLAIKSLALIHERSYGINILVTTTQLVPTLAKLMLYGLAKYFPIDHVYSATDIGKRRCFEKIVNAFGKDAEYVVIGDRIHDKQAAEEMHFKFWKVQGHRDLMNIHRRIIHEKGNNERGRSS
ncbi:protein phosphatase EYA1-like [Styela clava]